MLHERGGTRNALSYSSMKGATPSFTMGPGLPRGRWRVNSSAQAFCHCTSSSLPHTRKRRQFQLLEFNHGSSPLISEHLTQAVVTQAKRAAGHASPIKAAVPKLDLAVQVGRRRHQLAWCCENPVFRYYVSSKHWHSYSCGCSSCMAAPGPTCMNV